MFDKTLIKKCGHCKKFYYGDKPHFMKQSACDELEEIEKNFREVNKIPSWEVHQLGIGMDDYLINFQYDESRTLRNFMKLVADKLDIK